MIIVHSDVIYDPASWKLSEDLVVLENMDQRKSGARTAKEIKFYFEALPKARFCFDVGHARQVDLNGPLIESFNLGLLR